MNGNDFNEIGRISKMDIKLDFARFLNVSPKSPPNCNKFLKSLTF